MKTIVVVLALVALAVASPLKWRPKANRTYLPEEEDPLRVKYLLFQDERGALHFEDLTREVPEIRAKPKDVTLYLYTQSNQDDGIEIRVDKLGDLTNSSLYNPNNNNYFIMHGWLGDHATSIITILKRAILKKSNSNVFVVGWGRIAKRLYTTSRKAVPKLGMFVGDFINSMMNHYEISPKMFKLIGHSLGAHMAGCAGAQVNGLVDYIAGLDPAGPLYTIGNTENRLDETDGEFVHIVHTSSTFLGFGSSIGHADYYANGGSSQPGCGIDIAGTCAHERAVYYYEESILEGGFTSTECNSYKSYKKGKCEDNHVSYLGSLDVDRSASGDYYFKTNKKSPFSKE